MAQGNKGFADLIQKTGSTVNPESRLPPRTGILNLRGNRLAELATGNSLTRVQEFVDPARCLIWEGHNRDYAALNETNCADLIESFRAQRKQEVAAIVRRVSGNATHDFEVICGARRHWTVSWLRANSFPEFKFLIEPRELTDEEAFRLADLENRHRRDLSDYERATDYARAVERYYDGSQQKMVERLEVTKSWLSRYLELARLPAEVVAAFGSSTVIGISHGAALGPLLRIPVKRARMIAAADVLSSEQVTRVSGGSSWLTPNVVVKRLIAATEPSSRKKAQAPEHVVRNLDGEILARGLRKGRGGTIAITLPETVGRPRAEVLSALSEILDKLGT
jgi:ParB family transcriptional regulator, chromosome partitioning protein